MGQPHSHWKTTTFVAGLTLRRMIAPFVLDGRSTVWLSRPMSTRCWSPNCAQEISSSWTTCPSHKGQGSARASRQPVPSSSSSRPYSPDLNPIEMAFSKLKALLRKAAERTVDGLWAAIARILETFAPRECRNYFVPPVMIQADGIPP